MFQDVDVALLECAIFVCGRCLDGHQVEFYGIGSGLFQHRGEVFPFLVGVAVDAGYHGNGAGLLAVFHQSDVFVQIVGAHVTVEVVVGLRVVFAELVCGLPHDLFFKQRFKDDGCGSGLFQPEVLLCAVGQPRTAHDERVLQFQSGKGGFQFFHRYQMSVSALRQSYNKVAKKRLLRVDIFSPARRNPFNGFRHRVVVWPLAGGHMEAREPGYGGSCPGIWLSVREGI